MNSGSRRTAEMKYYNYIEEKTWSVCAINKVQLKNILVMISLINHFNVKLLL